MKAIEKVAACQMFIDGLEQQKNQQNDIENEVTEYVQSIFKKEIKSLSTELTLEVMGLFKSLNDIAHREEEHDV